MTPTMYRALARRVRRRWGSVVALAVASAGGLFLVAPAMPRSGLAGGVLMVSLAGITWSLGLLLLLLWFGDEARSRAGGGGLLGSWSRVDEWLRAVSATILFLSPAVFAVVFFGIV
jgi:hypothetical protein